MILNDDELHYAHTFDELRDIICRTKGNNLWTTNHVLDLMDIESMLADIEDQVREDAKLFLIAIKPIIEYITAKLDYDNISFARFKEIVREQEKENLQYIENKSIRFLFYEVLGLIEVNMK